MTQDLSLILMGRIVAAHGVRGEVKVISHSAEPSALFAYRLHRKDGAAAPKLTLVRADKTAFIARVDGITDRNAAEALRGIDLYVPQDALPPPDENEVYHAQLIGLEVRNPTGTVLGRVTAVENFGASDLIEIDHRPNGAPSVYIPFTADYIGEITTDYVVVDAPEGFWE